MGAHSSRSRTTKDVIVFRHERFFTDPSIAALYPDYDAAKPLDQFKDEAGRDAGWSFRRIKTRLDVKATRDLMVKPGIDMDALLRHRDKAAEPLNAGDAEERAAAEADLDRINAEIEEGSRTNYAFAELECMTVETFGHYFRLDDDFTMADFHGNDGAKDASKKHPLAGKVPPVDPDWLDRIDEVVWVAAREAMNEQHGGATPDGKSTFRA
jgi:hypothetical protein